MDTDAMDDERREARARADATLINTVREHRVLWDPNHPQYHQTQPTSLAWGEVLTVLETKLGQKALVDASLFDDSTGTIGVPPLRRRWQNLKHSYRTFQKKASKKDTKTWRWYKYLRFLDGDETPADAEQCDFVLINKRENNVDDLVDVVLVDVDNNENNVDNDQNAHKVSMEGVVPKEELRSSRAEEAAEMHMRTVENVEGDRSRMFGHVVELYLREMDEEQQWLAQLEILEVLRKFHSRSNSTSS